MESLAQSNGIFRFVAVRALGTVAFVPDAHPIEKVKARGIHDHCLLALLFGAEEDGGAKDALESLNDSVVMVSILRKIKVVEHLRRAPKADDAAFLENGQGRDPDGDEAILAKRQSIPRMPDDIKSTFAVASGVS